jgi:nucleotide-binding universal stress UspA family protein
MGRDEMEIAMFTRILLGSDGSDQSLKAAAHAAEIAKRFDAELIALHVFQVPVAPVTSVGAIGIDAAFLEPPNEEIQEGVIRRTTTELDKAGVPYTVRREIGFSPAEVIVRTAEEIQADLIVLGSHGAGAVERFLLGSTSDRVLHHSPCAVLIIK